MDAVGQLVRLTLKMLDPVYNQGLRLCLGAFRTSPVESLYVDARTLSVGARHATLSLLYASKIKSLPKHATRDSVFDNGNGKPYLRVYIQLRIRHACHETR